MERGAFRRIERHVAGDESEAAGEDVSHVGHSHGQALTYAS
jgi:hypothetical protein